ncbi:MAG TPA: ATP-binding protein [Fimbriimonas sp.]|nr:ATP-binding protein [Fimbriimonas sp.]
MYSNKDPAFLSLSRRSILLPVLLMLLIVGVLSWLLQVTSTQATSINRSLAAIAQAERVLTLMIDFGDSWANYKTTGDKLFLQSYNDSRSKIPGELENLRALSGTSPATAAREERVESDLRSWMSAQSLVPPSLDAGPSSSRLLVNLKLNQVRGDVGTFILEERDDLATQVERQRRSALFLFVALGGGAFLAAMTLSYQSWKTIKTLSGRYEQALSEVTEKTIALERSNLELDKRVAERTNALNMVNQELEVFCYSAAHDLRAPLRWIIASTRIFMEDYGSSVPDEGLDELRRVTNAATRLSRLIDSLLEMARLGKAELNECEVNLSELCGQSILEIQSREWSGAVAVSVEPNITVYGDPLLLSLLVQNLIENAFKFCSQRGDGKIEIHARRDRSEVIVTVSDNGVGFDDALVDKLFTPFQRLHRDTEFAGTGMGLANAKRIVDRHGGRIWAESKPGKGATFRFALPVKTPAAEQAAASKTFA